jgi:hypothetical protein
MFRFSKVFIKISLKKDALHLSKVNTLDTKLILARVKMPFNFLSAVYDHTIRNFASKRLEKCF